MVAVNARIDSAPERIGEIMDKPNLFIAPLGEGTKRVNDIVWIRWVTKGPLELASIQVLRNDSRDLLQELDS